MSDAPDPRTTDDFGERLAALGAAVLRGLAELEMTFRHLGPGAFADRAARLAPVQGELSQARRRFADGGAPDGLAELCEQLDLGAGHVEEAVLGLLAAADARGAASGSIGPVGGDAVARVLAAMRAHCRAQEALYPLRRALPPLGRAFAEPALHGRLASLDPEPAAVAVAAAAAGEGDGWSVGLHRAGPAGGRGGFSLYVPEWTDGSRPLPLVVALHGGFGHGGDFLWTWLREARSRGALLLAPTSRGTTWSLDAPEIDGAPLRRMVAFVAGRWRVDPARVLLTGLSDGATFALLTGLHPESPFTALAPVAGVLHPMNLALGNLERAAGRPVRLVHGARDWMFPVALARMARDTLADAGADLVYREIEDLAHAYPREENAAILEWLDPGLAIPPA